MTAKPQATAQTLNVLEYIPAVEYIDSVLGFPQRDAHQRFKPELPHVDADSDGDGQQNGGEYLDYWHYVMDFLFDGVRNDTYLSGTYSFVDFADQTEQEYGPENWRTIIARVWAAEYPGEYTIRMSW